MIYHSIFLNTETNGLEIEMFFIQIERYKAEVMELWVKELNKRKWERYISNNKYYSIYINKRI